MKKRIPSRQCVACGQMKEINQLIRVVRLADGSLVIDPTKKMDGRGAYVCSNEACIKKTVKSKGLDRSFRMHVPVIVYDSIMKEACSSER